MQFFWWLGGIAAAEEVANWADVVVLAVGEPRNYSGEAESRTDIVIPDAQMQVALAVMATGKPVVALLKNGQLYKKSDSHLPHFPLLLCFFNEILSSRHSVLHYAIFKAFSPPLCYQGIQSSITKKKRKKKEGGG